MQNIDAQVDALLTDPVTANKYLSYFDKDIKKRCIEKSEFFAQMAMLLFVRHVQKNGSLVLSIYLQMIAIKYVKHV